MSRPTPTISPTSRSSSRAASGCSSTRRRRSAPSTSRGRRRPAGTASRSRSTCDSPADVDATYDALVDAGAGRHLAPWDAFWGQRYAVVLDPDGNPVDLFAALAVSEELRQRHAARSFTSRERCAWSAYPARAADRPRVSRRG